MKVGDRVRVIKSVVVYHHPQHKQKPFDLKGMEGEIVEIIGKPISANLPNIIRFESKFSAHLQDNEIEVVNS